MLNVKCQILQKQEEKMYTIEEVRKSAVGVVVDTELLNQFHVRKHEEVYIPTRYGELHAHVFYPNDGNAPYPMFVNMHGGGFVKGYRQRDIVFAKDICSHANCVVIDLDYQLAPEHKYPYSLNECYDAIKYIWDNPERFHVDCQTLTICGESAGANFALAISMMAGESGEFEPQLIIANYPSVDLVSDYTQMPFAMSEAGKARAELIQQYHSWYVDVNRADEPYASMIFAPQEMLAKSYPTMIITAEFDPLSAATERYGMRLMEAGVTVCMKRVMGANHDYLIRRDIQLEIGEQLIFDALKVIYNR